MQVYIVLLCCVCNVHILKRTVAIVYYTQQYIMFCSYTCLAMVTKGWQSHKIPVSTACDLINCSSGTAPAKYLTDF